MAVIASQCIWQNPCRVRWQAVTQAECSLAVERLTMYLFACLEEAAVVLGGLRGCAHMVGEDREDSGRSGWRRRWSTNYAAGRCCGCSDMPPLRA